ncbi:MAG: PilZ domain-containing protein [Candidatus Omnitrophota bacterium]|nr:PilZ domain-containing protein [Candidatus Omnitrophota bacterium]
MLKKYPLELEKRKYLRLENVFPVELQVLDEYGIEPLSNWIQGFTSNVSLGGMCLSINNLDEQAVALLTKKGVQLSLDIHIPLSYPATKAVGEVVWLNKIKGTQPTQYLVGIKYLMIDKVGLNRIMRHARWLKLSFKFAVVAAVILLFAFAAAFFYNLKLSLENKRLVEKLVLSVQKDNLAKREMKFLEETKERLMQDLSMHKNKILKLESRLKGLQFKLQEGAPQSYLLEINKLKQHISQASQEQSSSLEKISKVEEREKAILKEISYINKEKEVLEEQTIHKMLQWLSVHQNNSTGLLLSYEGDDNLKDISFIYDQALAAQVFMLFNQDEKAKKIFNFFIRKSQDKFTPFYNAYYASSGEVAEYAIHTGPNIWLGIALIQYTHKRKDLSYLPLIKKIANWLISIQEQDPEGGLRGGPKVTWFSTEHNLDGFAFFNMLYEITQDKKYELASKKILSWLIAHAYGSLTPPIKRGKGDSTIATDTYAWSIASLGPTLLKGIGMDPEKIMEFAEDNCMVTVNFKRPDGKIVEVSGFDFAKYTHMPRGGIVSSEWSAQMVIAYFILSNFYSQEKNIEKQEFYKNKASHYLDELNKLVISSPSPTGQGEGCLPYATRENVDTGHGWKTPRGSSTGSIAGTSYTIFARKNFNPLHLGGE